MAMTKLSSMEKFSSDARPLVDFFAEELAFIVPGQDSGLLAINSVAADLEDLVATLGSGPWSEGVEILRHWVDEIIQDTGVFSKDLVERLELWHGWMIDLIGALDRNQSPPALPTSWNVADDLKKAATTDKAAAEEPIYDEPRALPGCEGVTIVLDLAADEELLTEFHSECLDLLEDIERGVLRLEEQPDETATIDSIFRAFHTFKGGAGMLRIKAVADVAHELETLLDALRKKTLVVNNGITDIILSGADFLSRFTSALGEHLRSGKADPTIVLNSGDLIVRAQRACAGELPASRLANVTPPSDDYGISEEEEPGHLDDPLDWAASAPAPKSDVANKAPLEQPMASKANKSARSSDFLIRHAVSSVKVEAEKLDDLVNLVGELIIAQLMVVEYPDVVNIKTLELSRNLRQLSRVTGELQKNAVSLRMVPVGTVFQKMGRLVRDLGATQGKSVQLVLEGEDVELDRNIVDKIGDPLIHLIRNAVDHGIEPPADRIAHGKQEVGTIRLAAVHKRGGISIRIEDDGRGLNTERIQQKAVELGLLSTEAKLTEPEIFSLIFLPGMSTADVLTDVSGRGVGMDVVRETIQSLRGKIEIESTPGEGTVFTIMLPLTLAIIEGLFVGSGEDRYIIPTLSVRESFRPTADMLSSVHGRSEMVRVRGQQVPLIRLDRCLGAEVEATEATKGIIIVLESGDASRALLVDQLLGKQEVVIKNIGQIFDQQPLVSGGAIMVDGRVGLLLDVEKIIRMDF